MKWRGVIGRGVVFTFFFLFIIFFFRFLEKQDSNLYVSLVFLSFVGLIMVGTIEWITSDEGETEENEESAKTEKYGCLPIGFGLVWSLFVLFGRLPTVLAQLVSGEFWKSKGLYLFIVAFSLGCLYEVFLCKKNKAPYKKSGEVKDRESYDEERKKEGFFKRLFGNDKNNRFRR